MQIWNELTYINKSSIALGFFDGLHLGHRLVINNTINAAKENNTQSTVITFKNHPLLTLSNQNVEQILTIDEKLVILEKTGIDNVILLNFEDYAAIRALDYLENVLVKFFSPIAITTGFNHYFGFNKEGCSSLLREKKDKYGYKYYEIPPFVKNDNIVSCSVIRNMLHLGNFQEANELLGYRYFITGKVIEGDKIASKLGFPSANINYPENKINIPHGVYYVTAEVNGKEYNAILNHGYTTDLDNQMKLKTEAHILDGFNSNIYGENIKISFVAKIRNQIKFDNTEKLKAQIYRDIAFANIYKYFAYTRLHIQ